MPTEESSPASAQASEEQGPPSSDGTDAPAPASEVSAPDADEQTALPLEIQDADEVAEQATANGEVTGEDGETVPSEAPAPDGPHDVAQQGEPATAEATEEASPSEDDVAEPESGPTDDEDSQADAEGEDDAAEAQEGDTEAIPRMDTQSAAGIDDTPGAPVAKARVPWWPFLIYLVAWIALIGAAFYVISYEPDALPAFQQEDYAYVLLGGLILTAVGPLLALLVWFITWLRTPKGSRGGLLTSALLKGALVTIFGVLAWWGAVSVLDALRLGIIGPIS
jgi:hypothetical protein